MTTTLAVKLETASIRSWAQYHSHVPTLYKKSIQRPNRAKKVQVLIVSTEEMKITAAKQVLATIKTKENRASILTLSPRSVIVGGM